MERLICHPRLPLVAGLDAERPAVHVWDVGAEPQEVAVLDPAAPPYGEATGWDRLRGTPCAGWHPREPLLALGGAGGLRLWRPDAGLVTPAGPPPGTGYRAVAFSPDGGTVWASPAKGTEDVEDLDWNGSHAVDLASGTLRTGPWWDTGLAPHPGGRLALALSSDQGATRGLLLRLDGGSRPGALRVLNRALILDVDGYEVPELSPGGGHVAVRGSSYENTLQVFEFPSLRLVLATTLGEPNPGFPYPPEWLERFRAWPRHNVAFAAHYVATLLVGTVTGDVVAIDVVTREAVAHPVLAGDRVTALAVAATGEILVAGDSSGLLGFRQRAGGADVTQADVTRADVARADVTRAADRVDAFLATTRELPAGADLYTELDLTDGRRTWTGGELDHVTSTSPSDPTWLRLRAAVNHALGGRDGGVANSGG